MLLLFGNFYFSPIGMQSIVMAAYLYVLSVYLSASISQKLLVQSLRNILSAVVIYGLGLHLLWRRCDTLRISGFVDGAMFAYNVQAEAMRKGRMG